MDRQTKYEAEIERIAQLPGDQVSTPWDGVLETIEEERRADLTPLERAAPDMLAALIEVQRAIACDRDGERYVHPVHGVLALEEVKYLIVDVAIGLATGEPQ